MVAFAIGAQDEMEFRVLGSLEVVDHDGPVALGAPKQQDRQKRPLQIGRAHV